MSCGTGLFLNENAISAVPVARSIGATNQLFDKAYQVHIAASRVVSLSLSVPVGFTALPDRGRCHSRIFLLFYPLSRNNIAVPPGVGQSPIIQIPQVVPSIWLGHSL